MYKWSGSMVCETKSDAKRSTNFMDSILIIILIFMLRRFIMKIVYLQARKKALCREVPVKGIVNVASHFLLFFVI